MFCTFKIAAILAVLCALAMGPSGFTQQGFKQPPAKSEPSEFKRILYVVKGNDARELAAVLNKHFNGDARFEAAPDSAGQMLLINAKAPVTSEVLETLQKMDRRPQVVVMDVIMVDVARKKGADSKDPVTLDEKLLSGPADVVLANIRKLQAQGIISEHRHIQLSGLENQSTRLLDGGPKAYITGLIVTTGVTGKPTARSTIQYKDVGSHLTLTPRVAANDGITLALVHEDVRAVPSTTGVVLGADENGQPILATEFPKTTHNATVSMKSGQALLVKGAEAGSNQGKTLLVVSAKLLPQ